MPVPELFLHEICDQHDFNYWVGGSEKDRWKADWQLRTAGSKKAGWNPLKLAAVYTYYLAVVSCGWTCFHYADKERDENDLVQFLKEKIIDLKDEVA